MSGIFGDPSSLTKEKLKRELSLHNVSMPSPSAKKDVYVNLYRTHVLPKQRSEFSSDDDESLGTPRKNKKKPGSPRKSVSTKSGMEGSVDVYSLSDKDLADMLRKMGENPGPIMDSTRKVYQKKLDKLLKAGPAEPVATNGPVEEEEEEEEEEEDVQGNTEDTEKFSDEEEEDIAPVIPVRGNRRLIESRAERTETRRRPARSRDSPDRPALVSTNRTSNYSRQPHSATQDTMPLADSSQDTYTFSTTSTSRATTRSSSGLTTRTLTGDSIPTSQPSTAENDVKGAKPKKEKKKGGLSIFAQIVIFLVVVLFIFLVIQNMDPAYRNKAKQMLTGGNAGK